MGAQEQICRLCLKVCDNFKAIEGDMKRVLDAVLSKIDLAVIQQPVMCTNCTEELIKCSNFKAECLNTGDNIIPFVNKYEVKLNLKDAYLRKSENGTAVPEDQDVCGFCMAPVINYSAVLFDLKEGGDVMLKKMIEYCLPELDLSVIEKPVICPPCHSSLENCFRFMTNCLIVEKKIKNYCQTLDIDSRGQVELSSLLQFTLRNVTKSEEDDNSVDIIKTEFCEERDNDDERKIDNDGNIYKIEQIMCEEGTLTEMEDQKFLVKEEIEIKDEQDFDRFESGVSPQPEITTRLHKMRKRVPPNLEEDLSKPCIRNTLTKYNLDIKNHCQWQRKPSKLPMYQYKNHKNPSDVTINPRSSCSRKAKYNCKKHFLKHKGPSEVTMHKCDSCSFQTNRKGNLERHSLLHKNSSEVTMYKCDFCSFRTRRNDILKVHLLVHKVPSEVTMYKCNTCSFQTKHKNALKKHLLLHKVPSEVTMYSCDFCSYQTKWKGSLGSHLLLHKNPSELTVYKCDSCSYQTKRKGTLKTHLLLHKGPSEVKMHKCDYCSYQTKYKNALNTHFLLHKGPSEVIMYKCASCSYQAKRKGNLRKHLLLHKGPSEATMLK